MKRTATLIAAGSLLAAFALAQRGNPGYTVIDLGGVGNVPPGQQFFISANGLIAGASSPDGTGMHATVWYKGQSIDLGKAGVGRPNSAVFGVNERGQVVGQADTTIPNAEDFCGFNVNGFKSSTACIPFLWQNGVMQPLPTLGGANGVASLINNRGQVAGWAQATAPAQAAPSDCSTRSCGNMAVSAGCRSPPVDNSGLAAAINDNGQVAGASGTCSPYFRAPGLSNREARDALGTATAHLTTWEISAAPAGLRAITPAL